MRIKVEGWPNVLPDDDGLRPAGSPDRCFYCDSRVGGPHEDTCVTVTALVRYKILYEGRVVGKWIREDPWSWGAYECEFHKNDSSWCANNAVGEIEWNDPQVEKIVKDVHSEGKACVCSLLTFEFDGVEDEGPFICRPDPKPEGSDE